MFHPVKINSADDPDLIFDALWGWHNQIRDLDYLSGGLPRLDEFCNRGPPPGNQNSVACTWEVICSLSCQSGGILSEPACTGTSLAALFESSDWSEQEDVSQPAGLSPDHLLSVPVLHHHPHLIS